MNIVKHLLTRDAGMVDFASPYKTPPSGKGYAANSLAKVVSERTGDL
jgi:hypothetical protein